MERRNRSQPNGSATSKKQSQCQVEENSGLSFDDNSVIVDERDCIQTQNFKNKII